VVPNQTVCRLLVGNELRRAREAAGMRLEDAAAHIGAKISKISRLELGQTRVTVAEVTLLLQHYGAEAQHIAGVTALARTSNQRGRWDGHRSVLRHWFRTYVDLEAGAAEIRQAQSEIIPGLLQVESYIRAIHDTGPRTLPAEDVDDHVAARQERQRLFHGDPPPRVSFVLSEACLRREIGGPVIMQEQLAYLIEVAGMPSVQLQVLPFRTKTYVASEHNFCLLTVGAPEITSSLNFVYLEDYDDARYLDDEEAVRAYGDLWRRLTASALGPVESLALVRAVATSYNGPGSYNEPGSHNEPGGEDGFDAPARLQ
jgi:transcriptional regulator with XRE-family HTH domain